MKTFTCKQEIPNELLDHDPNIVNYVVEKMVNELAKGIADVLSDGELYAIQMKKPEIDGLGALNQNCTAYRSTVEYTPMYWIPCSVRVPQIKEHHCSDPVWVTTSDGIVFMDELEENIFGQTVFSCERDTPFGESNHEVIAWMPVIVPEPYKEDGSE